MISYQFGSGVCAHELSWIPLKIIIMGTERIGYTGTGFVYQYRDRLFLVTCKHIFTGKSSRSGQLISPKGVADPQHAQVVFGEYCGPEFEQGYGPAQWTTVTVNLRDKNGKALWQEHPVNRFYDIAALPIDEISGIKVYPITIEHVLTDIILYPSEPISVIGFPFGLSSLSMYPIWKTVHLASDIDLPIPAEFDQSSMNDELSDCFLVDGHTKPGMSGAPVYAIRIGGYRSCKMGWIVKPYAEYRFLGMYSSRITDLAHTSEPSLGRVWRAETIIQTVTQ